MLLGVVIAAGVTFAVAAALLGFGASNPRTTRWPSTATPRIAPTPTRNRDAAGPPASASAAGSVPATQIP